MITSLILQIVKKKKKKKKLCYVGEKSSGRLLKQKSANWNCRFSFVVFRPLIFSISSAFTYTSTTFRRAPVDACGSSSFASHEYSALLTPALL